MYAEVFLLNFQVKYGTYDKNYRIKIYRADYKLIECPFEYVEKYLYIFYLCVYSANELKIK